MFNQKVLQLRKQLMIDFPFYAKNILKINSKDGIKPFFLNKAQLYVHNLLQNQLSEHGRVRALVLKGRQMGISTYIEGRFFWRVTHRFGVRAFILTHEDKASRNLFGMCRYFYDNCPPELKPKTSICNSESIYFNEISSGYSVGTAGNPQTGRSATLNYFHWSESAHCKNDNELARGILQAIPLSGENEIILETTANGRDNYFYEQWQLAVKGESSYLPIFVWWGMDPTYCLPVPLDFVLSDEEEALTSIYNLTPEQLMYRRYRVAELSTAGGDGALGFRQEYPNNPEEAFDQSVNNTLIRSDDVMRCFNNPKPDLNPAPLILGVDVARFGNDYTVFIRRRGNHVYKIEKFKHKDGQQLASLLFERIKDEKFDHIFIDIIGIGAALFDCLKMTVPYDYFSSSVHEINGASTSTLLYPSQYMNKRAEMWGMMSAYIKNDRVSIEDNTELLNELCCQTYFYSHGKLGLPEKKKDHQKSPDIADALSFTFAMDERRLLSNKTVHGMIDTINRYSSAGYFNGQ